MLKIYFVIRCHKHKLKDTKQDSDISYSKFIFNVKRIIRILLVQIYVVLSFSKDLTRQSLPVLSCVVWSTCECFSDHTGNSRLKPIAQITWTLTSGSPVALRCSSHVLLLLILCMEDLVSVPELKTQQKFQKRSSA